MRIRGLLHDHMDGSEAMSDVIANLYSLSGRAFPFPSVPAWKGYFIDEIYVDIVRAFSTITSVMQNRETLELAAYAYGLRRAREGYDYVEAKFAPDAHTVQGLNIYEVTEAIRRGFAKAERETGIQIVPVVCIDRGRSVTKGIAIAKLALFYGREVILDMACDEAGHPPEKHARAFRITKGHIRRECHAGEWVSPFPSETYAQRLLQNVRTAVEVLQVDGLGHARTLAQDSELVARVVGEGIRVTGCPASYLHTGLISSLAELRYPYLLDRGVKLTVNPDDDLFLPTQDKVISLVEGDPSFTEKHRRQLEDNVRESAFAKVLRT